MNRASRFSLLVAAIVCVTLVCSERAAWGDPPETVSLTFALTIPVDPFGPDPVLELSQCVGEDTVVILFGRQFGGGINMSFRSGYCGSIDVGDTEWRGVGQPYDATIVNKGGRPIDAKVWTDYSTPTPHPRSVLHAHNITSVDACYYGLFSGNIYDPQNEWDPNTDGVFIIVTGEFRVTN